MSVSKREKKRVKIENSVTDRSSGWLKRAPPLLRRDKAKFKHFRLSYYLHGRIVYSKRSNEDK